MTTWIFKAKPPYPKNKGDHYHFAVSSLRIEDNNNKIDFYNDEELWFELNFELGGQIRGSIRSYARNQKTENPSSFVFEVEYNSPFVLTIKSYLDVDLSNLAATFFSCK